MPKEQYSKIDWKPISTRQERHTWLTEGLNTSNLRSFIRNRKEGIKGGKRGGRRRTCSKALQ